METTLKRFLSLVLAFTMVLSYVPVQTFADEPAPVECAEHQYNTVTTNPTCTEGGYTTYTCSVCGTGYTDEATEATGHSYASVVTDPTCTDGGYTTNTCGACGDAYVSDEVAALGHDFADGICSVCGDADPDAQAEDPTETTCEHNYQTVTKDPTCTAAGSKVTTCSKCGDSSSEEIAATGHKFVDGVCACGEPEKAEEEPEEDEAVKAVQAMIDALRTSINEGEEEAAQAEYDAAAAAIGALTEEQRAQLDLTNFYAAAVPTVIPAEQSAGLIGFGTETEPYLISSKDDLILFRDSVNAGETEYNAPGVWVALGADIDLSGTDWSVNIGDDCNATFDGIFDGKGKTISNLTSTETAQKGDVYVCTGLFGAIGGDAVIKNLTIKNVKIDTGDFTGNNAAAVVGFAYDCTGSIENVKVTGEIEINAKNITGTGVIVGYDYHGTGTGLTIKNCAVEGVNDSYIIGRSYVGGVVGYANKKIQVTNNIVEGIDVTATGGGAGGIAGILLAGGEVIGNTVKNIAVSAQHENWLNSAAAAVGCISGTAVKVSGTEMENVTGSTAVVGSVHDDKPTAPVAKVQAEINGMYYGKLSDAANAAQPGNAITLLTDVDEAVEIPDGVQLNKGDFNAPNVEMAVAKVGSVFYKDLQEAIKAAAPSGTVELLCDVTVDKWVMISETLTIGGDTLITLDMNGLTIEGNGHILTIKDVESAGNGNHIFYDGDYNICDLTVVMGDGVNGFGITSGTIENVTFIGGRGTSGGAAIHVNDGLITGVHAGDVIIDGCTFQNNGGAIYYETAQDGLVVNNNTFKVSGEANVILLRGAEKFTNNTIVSGRTVNVVSGSPVVSGNDFGNVRFKVYNEATATISGNKINNLAFNDETDTKAAFSNNTLSTEAEAALKAVTPVAAEVNGVEYYTLAEAAAAAKAGDEIILLADVAVEGTLALPAGIKLTSNGNTITGSIRMLGNLELNGPLTITDGLWVGEGGKTLTAALSGDKLTASYFMFQYGTYTINADIDAVYGYLSYNGTFDVNSTIHTTGANGEVLYINGNVTLNDGAVLDSDNSVFVCNDNAVLTLKAGSKVDSKVSITKSGAKVYIDATGMTDGATANITGTVTNSGNGTIAVTGNDLLTAKIEGGKIVLAEKELNGEGTSESPYLINNLDDLKMFAQKVNAGNSYEGKYVKLTAGINLASAAWTPIGSKANPFKGTFDGDGKIISNLNVSGDSYLGLFGYLGTPGEIKNVKIENVNITGVSYLGAVVGMGYTGKITNCHVSGSINIAGNYMVGGINGHGYAVISDCSVVGNTNTANKIVATHDDGSNEGDNVGGIVGHNGENNHITGCSVKNVTISGTRKVGGIVGITDMNSKITGCTVENVIVETSATTDYAAANLKTMSIGGIVGQYQASGTGGAISGCTVSDLTFNNVHDVTVSAGTLTGGMRGTSEVLAPSAAIDTTGSTVSNVTGATTSYLFVAKIGNVEYNTLQAAVNAAQAGDTITLLKDIEQKDGVTITDKKLTIDLNGKTFTVTEGASTNNRNFKINGASVVTIQNGTMVAKGDYSSGAYGTVRTEGTANVTLTDLKLYNYRGNGLNVKAVTGTTVTMTDVEVYAQYGGGIESAGGTIELTNVTVEQKGMYTAPYNSMAISVNGGGTVIVNSGTYTTECLTAEEANNQGSSHGPWAAGVLNSGGTLIINGGTFANDNFGENSLATYARGLILADTGAVVEINGGTFNALKNIFDIQNNLGDATKQPGATVYGGTFSAKPTEGNNSSLITVGYGLKVQQNSDGTYGVVSAIEAKVGTRYYETLEAALAAAQNGNVIELMANITADVLTVSKNVTIRCYDNTLSCNAIYVKDGKELTLNGNVVCDVYADTVTGGAKINGVTITGIQDEPSKLKADGTLSNPGWVAIAGNTYYLNLADAIAAGGNVTLVRDIELNEAITIAKGKTVTLDLNGKTITGTDNETASFGLFTNNGELTVTGNGTITLTAKNDRGWNAYSSLISNTVGGKLIVENGTIEHLGGTDMAYAIDNLTNGKGTYAETVINGGNILSTYRPIRQFLNGIEAQNILTVNGGTIESTGGNKAIWMQDPSKNANSGTLTIGANAVVKNDVYLDVTEGSTEWPVTVSIAAAALAEGVAVKTENVPAGYELAAVNGTYGVYSGVAKIGTEYYATLEAAIEAAQAGDTVTLLKNVQVSGTQTISKSITIDGNGNTITQTEDFAANGSNVVFDITTGTDITFENTTFNAIKTVGVIRTVGANLVMDNCTVQNCQQTVSQGLLRLACGNATITNSKFLNNTCTMAVTFNFDAGNADDTFLVDNCVFEGNTASGTALVYYVKGAKATITKSEFVNNKVNCNSNGATIYLGFTENNVVTGNLFQNNVVTDSSNSTRVGGAIFFGYEADVSGNAFINNTASNANGDVLGQVCTSTYYDCDIDLSGNYWGGSAPVYGKDYTIQHQTGDATFALNNYFTTCNTDENGDVVLSNEANISYAVQVGKTPYNTITEALMAAQSGDIITLFADVEANAVLMIDKSVTINGNGHKVTSNATRVFRVTTSNVEVTLNDVNMVSNAVRVGTNDIRGISIDASLSDVVLTLNNCSVDFTDASASDWSYAVNISGSGSGHTVTVDGGTYEGANVINANGANNTVTVTGATLNSLYPNNDVYYGACIYVVQDQNSSIVAKNNTFSGSNAMAINAGDTPIEKENNTDNTTMCVAKIGDTYYTSLVDAFAAATAEDTVILLHNVDGITVPAGRTVTLDLNGKNIVGTTNAITNNGILTINDSVGTGKVYTTDVSAQGHAAIVNNGTLTINGGWFGDSNNDTTDRNAINRGNALKNYGTATINGGYFTNVSNQYIDTNAFAYAINTLTGGTTTINNATIYGDINGLIYSDGKTVVNDGSFTLGRPNEENNLWYLAYGDVEIKGGTWTRAFKVPSWNTGDPKFSGAVAVSGGKFNVTVPEAYCAEGYIPAVNADGTYSVKQGVYVARVNDSVGYETLQDAFAAAQSGQTVTLLADITVDTETITIADGKSFTLNMNGKKITVTDNSTSNYELFYIYGELTVTGNGTIDMSATNDRDWNASSSIFHNRGGKLTIENGTFTHNGGTDMAYVVDNSGNSYGDATTNIVSGTLTSSYIGIRNRMETYGGNGGGNGVATLNVSGGTISGTSRAIWAQASSTSTTSPATGKINISGGSIGLIETARNAGAVSMTTITGGTVEAFKGEVNELTVTGGTLGEVTILDASGNAADYAITAGGLYTNAVAKVGETNYATLAEAVAAAQSGDTITMLAHVTLTEGVTVPADKTVTLDLNGKTISTEITETLTKSFALISNKGTLTVKDSATDGKLSVEYTGGSFGYGVGLYTISNEGGTLNVESGTIENLATVTGSMYDAIDNNSTLGDTILNVTGGNISCGGYIAIRQFANSTTYENTVNVTGGVVNGGNCAIWTQNPGNNQPKANINIKNGEFTGRILMGDSAAFATNISGGTYSDQTVKEYLANGYTLEVIGDRYGVKAQTVATVGGKIYGTLDAAIEAAANGQTILLLNNVLLNDTVTIPADKIITLDLNGYDISQTKECTASYSMIENKGNLTIKDSLGNGKISFTDTGAGDAAASWGSYTIHNTGTLVVENGTIENLSAQNVTEQAFAHTALAIFQYSGSTTINGGKISTPNYRSVRLWHGDMTINGGTFDGQVWVQAVDNTAKLTIDGGTFEPNWNDGSSVFVENASYDVDFQVTGGTFVTKIGTSNAEKLAGSVQGGLFTEAAKNNTATALLGDDFTFASEADENGYYTVIELPNVATVDGKGYKTLQAAIEAANDGDEIILLAPVTVAAGETLELNKAVKITYTSDVIGEAMITNNGILVIDGAELVYTYTGEGDASFGKGNYTIANMGTLTVNSGLVENATAKMSHASYAIDNRADGQVTINDGKVLNTNNYAIRQFASGSNTNTVTVNGGEVIGTRAVWIQLPGSDTSVAPKVQLTVTGGILEGTEVDKYDNMLAVYSYSYGNNMKNVKIDISGGKFYGDIALTGGANKTDIETLNISGGTFDGYWGEVISYGDAVKAEKAITITGGSFSTADAEIYATTEGYEFVRTGRQYIATKIQNVAKIGSAEYRTLQDAVNAADAGAVITLIGTPKDYFVKVNKKLTIQTSDEYTYDHELIFPGTDLEKVVEDTYLIKIKAKTTTSVDEGPAVAYVDLNNNGTNDTGETVISLKAALNAAKTAETKIVRLVDNLTLEDAAINIPVDVTLDIQAYTLTVDTLIGLKGSSITAIGYSGTAMIANSGKLVVAPENLVLAEEGYKVGIVNNAPRYILPIWDPNNDCFVFSLFVANTSSTSYGLYIDEANETIEFKFKHQATTAINDSLLKDGAGDNELAVMVHMEWQTYDKEGKPLGMAYQDFHYSDYQVGQVTGNFIYTCTLKNYTLIGVDLATLKVSGRIVTTSGATAFGDVWEAKHDKLN